MRIAYICADPGVPVWGNKGNSIHVQEVIRAMLRQGVTVELFANRTQGEPPADLAGVPVHQLPRLPKGEAGPREQAALAANDVLRAALERAGHFDLVYERYSLWSYAGMDYARRSGTPGVLEVNAPLIEEQAQYRGLVNRAGAEWVAQRVFGTATALVAVSAGVAAYLEQYPPPRGRVYVVPNGVNPERFPAQLASSRPGPAGVFTVGFVGTLKPWHGLPVLVDAFDRLHGGNPNCRLLVVGDGTERAWLETELAGRGLSAAVELTGAVVPEAVPGLLASMDVAVAPYPQYEHCYFSPLKVFEYMAAGLPVVASEIGQIAELIQHKENGLLCPPGDAQALAAALQRLWDDTGLRIRLGQAARASVLREHTWNAVVGRIIDIAKQAFESGHSAEPVSLAVAREPAFRPQGMEVHN